MDLILFGNDDIEDDSDFIFSKTNFESVSFTISSTASAVAAALNNNEKYNSINNDFEASTTTKENIFDETKIADTTQKTNLQNLMPFNYKQLTDREFKNSFYMTRKTFEALCYQVHSHLKPHKWSVEDQLAFTLWILHTEDDFLSIAGKLCQNVDSLLKIFISTCRAISKLSSQLICWPQTNELAYIAEMFKVKAGLPGVVGVIGTANIISKISNPGENSATEIIAGRLQAVCDFKLRFVNINIDVSRSSHYSFSADRLFHKFLVNNLKIKSFYIIGDVGFPLLPTLLTPFENNGKTPLQEAQLFNKYHSITRNYIHKSFQLLKHRFKRLKCLDELFIKETQSVVTSACVIHNLILQTESNSADDLITMDCGIAKGNQNADENQFDDRTDFDCLTSEFFKKNNKYKKMEFEGFAKRMEIAMSLKQNILT